MHYPAFDKYLDINDGALARDQLAIECLIHVLVLSIMMFI